MTEETSPNIITRTHVAQVGGTHYASASGTSHWDIMDHFDIPYLEATATKYVLRCYKKGCFRQDIEKAISYVEKMISRGRRCRRLIHDPFVLSWCQAEGLNAAQTAVMVHLLCNWKRKTLPAVVDILRVMLDNADPVTGKKVK